MGGGWSCQGTTCALFAEAGRGDGTSESPFPALGRGGKANSGQQNVPAPSTLSTQPCGCCTLVPAACSVHGSCGPPPRVGRSWLGSLLAGNAVPGTGWTMPGARCQHCSTGTGAKQRFGG